MVRFFFFAWTHQPTHEFNCRTSSGCRCLWGTHVSGHARNRYRVGQARLALANEKEGERWREVKGSVDRSLLPWAIFLNFSRNRSWKSEDYLCTLFFIEMSKERLEKSERTPPVSWRPWALAYSPIDRTTFHTCQRCRKTAVLAVFSRLRGVFWRGKAFREQQCQFLTRNKSLSSENESNCSMTSECVRTDSILPEGAGLEHGRCKQSIFSLSIFGILVERLSF